MAIIPQEVVTRVGRAHLAGQHLLQTAGILGIESVEVALAAEAHTWFWKPAQVKTLLFVNSRRFMTQSELSSPTRLKWLGSPTGFVRTLSCLAFSEPELAREATHDLDPTLWPLLADLAEAAPLAKTAGLADRLEWKVKIMRRLQEKGIWILDPVPFGLASPLPLDLAAQMIEAWRYHHLTPLIDELSGPEIAALGEEVAQMLTAGGLKVDQIHPTAPPEHPAKAPKRKTKGTQASANPSFAQ